MQERPLFADEQKAITIGGFREPVQKAITIGVASITIGVTFQAREFWHSLIWGRPRVHLVSSWGHPGVIVGSSLGHPGVVLEL